MIKRIYQAIPHKKPLQEIFWFGLLAIFCLQAQSAEPPSDPGYAWHNRATYPRDKIDQYNEFAAGGGLGKGLYNKRGNWEGLFALAFLDSHKNIEPAVGYAYFFTAHLPHHVKLGAGPGLFITQRPDIVNGIPFPALLPWVSATYRRATLAATYIPGAQGAGNVVFVVSKWRF